MSDLLNVLDGQADEISRAFLASLEQADASRMAQTASGGWPAVFRALRTCCQGDDAAAQNWAKALRAEAASAGIALSEVLAALQTLEQVVRFQVVKAIEQKTVLLLTLAELSDAVEQLRQAYAEVPSPQEKKADQELLDLAALAENVDAFVCMATLHGKPFYLNPAGRDMLGLDRQHPIEASNLHDFYTDATWRELRDEAVPAVQEHGHWLGQSTLRNARDDTTMHVITRLLLVKRPQQDRPSFLAILHTDAAAQIRLQEALSESEARKHAILESSLDPIITINHEGVITEFNRAAEQAFGHKRDKVLGTQPSEILFPPSMSAGDQNRIERYLNLGEGSMLGRRIEVTAERANGEPFAAEMAMTINHEQGAPVLTFFLRDISLRKKAEQEQARYQAELRRSNQELQQFAYVASHDLQEPLRKIRTFSDRLEMKCGDGLDDTGRECIQRMQNAAGRMQTLIEGLLTLSRVTTQGRGFERVDLAKVTADVVSDLETQIDRSGGRVELGRLPTIQADPLQMRQLLQNLIGNALKFHRPGAQPIVKVHGRFVLGRGGRRGADERCRIVVEDNGIGFDEKHLDRVFGVFQRLHPRDVYEGTGIGLAICRKIVERHGGEITARTEPGQGCAFEVLLPVLQGKQAEVGI